LPPSQAVPAVLAAAHAAVSNGPRRWFSPVRVSSVKMLAAADALRKRHRLPFDPESRAKRDRTLERLRAVLDRATVTTAWTAGHATPLDLGVGEALDLARPVADDAG
jgi:hypothetical protein